MTTPTTLARVEGTLDPVLAFCERSFSAILELTCIVQAILPNGPDGTAAKRRLTERIEALAEPIGKIRQANEALSTFCQDGDIP
jgi:hypothetical protein